VGVVATRRSPTLCGFGGGFNHHHPARPAAEATDEQPRLHGVSDHDRLENPKRRIT
jgi:hypothetical protein